jgi:hypothetical protein
MRFLILLEMTVAAMAKVLRNARLLSFSGNTLLRKHKQVFLLYARLETRIYRVYLWPFFQDRQVNFSLLYIITQIPLMPNTIDVNHMKITKGVARAISD